jgi:hypothetical protein
VNPELKHTSSFNRFQAGYQRLEDFYALSSQALPGQVEQLKEWLRKIELNPSLMAIDRIEKVDGPNAGALSGEKFQRAASFFRQALLTMTKDSAEKSERSLKDNLNLLREQSLTFLVTIFDSYLDDVAEELCIALVPRIWVRKRKRERLLQIIGARLYALRSVKEKMLFLKEAFEIDAPYSGELAKVIEMRKLFVHRGGVVAKRKSRPGVSQPVSDEFFKKACETIRLCVAAMDLSATLKT